MAYSDVVLADTPTIYWPLQETSGPSTVADLSGNGRTGTVAGAVDQAAGPTAATFALLFDSAAKYISQGTAFPTSTFLYTIEAWVFIPTGTTFSAATTVAGLSNGTGGSPDGMIFVDTDMQPYWYHRQHGQASFGVYLAKGYWHHLAVTVGDNGGSRMYINGVQTNYWGTNPYLAGYSSMFPFVHTGNWNGNGAMRIAHVAYYQSALTSTRVAAHYSGMGTLANPSVNTTTNARVYNQYADIAVSNKPRVQVYNEYVDVAILSIPRVQVFNQYVDVAVFTPVPGGIATSTPTVTLTSFPGTAGAYYSVSVAAPTAVINMSAIAGTRAALVLGPRADMVTSAGAGVVTVFAIDRSGATITLSLIQATIQGLPNTLGVRVAQGLPNAPAYFFLNAETEAVAMAYLDPQGGANSVTIPLDTTLSGGSNTITVYNTDDRTGASSSATFTIEGTTVVDATPTPYVPVRDEVTYWRFRDYVDPSVFYDFPMNPETVETPRSNAPISDMFTSSPSGNRILFEGASQPPVWSWSGRALDETHVRALETWARKKQRLYLTDHLGRRLTIKVESLQMTPVRDPERPWHHKYDMKARVFAIEEAP